ncbi:MAG: amidohydrolase family protein [Sphaerochaetaceae bacterium]|jgi:N-acetylglucosamine-6-phosphate deacetylase|nr:amidohydrolase family protein [Sphaerochaetaceae bacterium]NLO60697.1 amidohydrolase family protein [Spirochaetales bacterium]MDD2405397.1 amidohydrolase family protein [Sphaerochaetaceae bacterium]MDD3670104.1 amidohydrolase family protein [Sphaerochaetaceae bacterium]MDD4260538.1 amidohydrolase family protein [Sphaerochaetaceae bacterium]
MKTLIKNVCLILPDRLIDDAWLVSCDGVIDDFGAGAYPKTKFDSVTDGKGQYLSPGFVDTHVHGGDGACFHDVHKESILKTLRLHLKGGTTTILPTLTSVPHEKYIKNLELFAELDNLFHKMNDIPEVEGIHMEGPYCSGAALGAQDTKTYRDVNYSEVEKYLEIYPKIKKWTAACELKGGMEFGKYLERKGIAASLGHSNATLQQVFDAYDCGYHNITHLYSACSSYHRNGAYREGGIVEAAFLIDDMDVEMITDGVHLPKEFLQLIYKIKGPDHICLITDASRWAGVTVPEGSLKYADEEGTAPIYIENGVALVENRSCFAGSIATYDRLIRTATEIAGIDMVDAIRMATLTPARTIGLDSMIGSIARGKRANLVLFNDNIDIIHVFLKGNLVL